MNAFKDTGEEDGLSSPDDAQREPLADPPTNQSPNRPTNQPAEQPTDRPAIPGPHPRLDSQIDPVLERKTVDLIKAGMTWKEIREATGRSRSSIMRSADRHGLPRPVMPKKLASRPNGPAKKELKSAGAPKTERPVDYAASETLKVMAKTVAEEETAALAEIMVLGKLVRDTWGTLARLKLMTLGELLHTGMSFYIEYGGEITRLQADRDEWKDLANQRSVQLRKALDRTNLLCTVMVKLVQSGKTPTIAQENMVRALLENTDMPYYPMSLSDVIALKLRLQMIRKVEGWE